MIGFFKKYNHETNDSMGNHSKQKRLHLINLSISIPLEKRDSWNDGLYKDSKGKVHKSETRGKK